LQFDLFRHIWRVARPDLATFFVIVHDVCERWL
jgi:hypothetical protein